jgi:hypothetical protein
MSSCEICGDDPCLTPVFCGKSREGDAQAENSKAQSTSTQ